MLPGQSAAVACALEHWGGDCSGLGSSFIRQSNVDCAFFVKALHASGDSADGDQPLCQVRDTYMGKEIQATIDQSSPIGTNVAIGEKDANCGKCS